MLYQYGRVEPGRPGQKHRLAGSQTKNHRRQLERFQKVSSEQQTGAYANFLVVDQFILRLTSDLGDNKHL